MAATLTQGQRIACKRIHDLLAVAIHLAEQDGLGVIKADLERTANGHPRRHETGAR